MAHQTLPHVVSSSQTQLPIKSYAHTNRELAAAFDRYLQSRGMKLATRISYGNPVRDFVEFLGSASVGEVDRDVIRQFLGELYSRGLHENTLRLRTAALRAFFRFVQLTGLTKHNPTAMLSHRKLPGRLPRVLSLAEIERLIAAAKTPLEAAVVEWFYATGIRVSELASFRLDDIDFDTKVARVQKGKGGKDRIVLFGSKAEAAIRAMLKWRPNRSGFLFEASSHIGCIRCRYRAWFGRFYDNAVEREIRIGKVSDYPAIEDARRAFDKLLKAYPGYKPKPPRPYTDRAIRMIVSHMGVRAGIGRVYPHALRRALATHMLEHGADLRAIQDLLGHDRISTTAIYTGLSAANLKAIHTKFHPSAGGSDEKI